MGLALKNRGIASLFTLTHSSGFEATPNRHDSFGSPKCIQITDY